MFAAGIGAFFYGQRRTRGARLFRFLWTRGLWFILLELTVMQFAYNFSLSFRYLILLLILWIFGICMVAMAGLIYLPLRWLAAISIAVMLLHNCRRPRAARFGSAAWIWNSHQPGVLIVGASQCRG